MQGSGVEIRAVRPNQSGSIDIVYDPLKKFQIARRSEEFTSENRSKIDYLFRLVVELNTQGVIGNDLDCKLGKSDVSWEHYLSGAMGSALRPSCSRCQSAWSNEFRLVHSISLGYPRCASPGSPHERV